MNDGPETSVVIQGPVHGLPSDPPDQQLTRLAVASVRQHMPGAEIIVSTWKGSATDHLGADLVVLNDDPGAVALADSGFFSTYKNNLNRQLVSTQAALRAACRRYAVKMRTDTLLVKPTPVAKLGAKEPTGPLRIFRGQVAALNVFTHNPLKRPVLFHLSDLFHAGLREDLLTLWELPLVPEPSFTRAIDPRRRPLVNVFAPYERLERAAPEQYLGESLCRRLDDSIWLKFWLSVLASNFQVLTPDEAGIRIPERLAVSTQAWDLLQPEDRLWLREWAGPSVPPLTRLKTAGTFLRVRWAYQQAGIMRRLPAPVAAGVRRIRQAIS
jgi:hypothetical protein